MVPPSSGHIVCRHHLAGRLGRIHAATCMRTSMPSATTMALSTSMPSAITRAPSETRCSSMPNMSMIHSVPATVMSSTAPMMRPTFSPMKSSSTTTTMPAPAAR